MSHSLLQIAVGVTAVDRGPMRATVQNPGIMIDCLEAVAPNLCAFLTAAITAGGGGLHCRHRHLHALHPH